MVKIRNKILNYDASISIRIGSETLEKFKKYAPKYQTKIRELIENYVKKCEMIEKTENEIRLKNINFDSYTRR